MSELLHQLELGIELIGVLIDVLGVCVIVVGIVMAFLRFFQRSRAHPEIDQLSAVHCYSVLKYSWRPTLSRQLHLNRRFLTSVFLLDWC